MFCQMKIVILSIFTVNILRCSAIPTSQISATMENLVQSSEYSRSEKIQHHEKNEKSVSRHYDCQGELNFIQSQISLITKMLQDGDEVLRKQKSLSAEQTVLVLGRAGSGKSSLVQFLTGNPQLSSKLVKIETGEYIIEDGVKIGTSATESNTLYPELVKYNSTVNFCDSPGFHDLRSSAHEIVAMNAMRSITDEFKMAKIVLLENHGSLQYGVSKGNFINLLRHVNDFVVDIDRYRENIVLIATKVPYTYRMTEDVNIAPKIIPDEIIIESIAEYINYTETSFTRKLEENISINEKEFYNKVIRLLQSLQTRDQDGRHTKINVFHRPYKSGQLKEMSLLENNKKSLLNTIMNLEFVEVEENDFDYTLSDTAKIYLECLLKVSNDEYKSKINEISLKLGMHINTVKQNYSNFHEIVENLSSWNKKLEELSENLDETKSYNEFLELVHNFISINKIPLEYKYHGQVNALENYEKMLQKYVDTSSIFKPTATSIRQVIRSVKDDFQWYGMLQKLVEEMSSYKVQSNKTIISKTFFETNSQMQDLIDVLRSNDELIKVIDFKKFFDIESNEEKAKEIQLIMESTLQENNITCDSEGRLIVKGFYVRLSEISSKSMVRSYCNDTTLKEAAILAVDTLFIDEDTDDVFKGVNLFIAAPKWNVIGQRSIDLSGLPGKNISENQYVDNTKNGKPGLPGRNGGSFFGIGLHFSNGEGLSIKSNGGQGGPGVDGGKGDDGENGTNAIDKPFDENTMIKHIIKTGRKNENFNSSKERPEEDLLFTIFNPAAYYYEKCKLTSEIDWYMQDGDCGSLGSSGGNGGKGGFGGFSGELQMIGLSESSGIHLESQNGSRGSTGRPGEHGKNGKNGNGVAYFKIKGLQDSEEATYWKTIETGYSSCVEVAQNQTFSNKTPQMKIEPPIKTKFTDTSYYLRQYVVLFEAHSGNAVFNSTMTEFQVALKNKFSYNLNEMGLLFL